MREPIVLKTESQASLRVEIDRTWAELSIDPPLGMRGLGVIMTLAEVQALQQALGKAAAHLRGMKRAA